jgi:UDP-3-O-[3-hydroxymyristoyl] glucosamine N-acyltransferase
VIVPPGLRDKVPQGSVSLVSSAPIIAWARVAALFYPVPGVRAGIHPTACIASDAMVDDSVEVSAHAVIGAGAQIGPRCLIGPGATIGEGVVMGQDCRIGSHASITHSILGARVYIYSGARVGQEGFGFDITDVHIGRHCAIAAQCGIAGSVEIGDFVVMGGQAAIAPHVTVGSKARIGAQAGVMSDIGEGAIVVGSPARPRNEFFREIATLKKQARR